MKPEKKQPTPIVSGSQPAKAPRPIQTGGVADLAPNDPREHIEPGEEERPLSLLYISFLCVLFGWGGYYTQRYSGGFGALSYNENASGLGPPKTNAVQNIDPYALGQRVFSDTCAKCHQPDGLGLPGQYPPLVGSEWALAPGPARMIRIALDGLQGPIKVKGLDFNNTMTPHRDVLTDLQIASAITYVRTQKDWGNKASPVAPEEVAAIRKKTKDRPAVGSWTVPDLLAVPETEPMP
ncbi:MAG: cytochrome c [Verrucomicrobia bacterium]|nr:cytochrome c [Verrucomicrobiota bacterium]